MDGKIIHKVHWKIITLYFTLTFSRITRGPATPETVLYSRMTIKPSIRKRKRSSNRGIKMHRCACTCVCTRNWCSDKNNKSTRDHLLQHDVQDYQNFLIFRNPYSTEFQIDMQRYTVQNSRWKHVPGKKYHDQGLAWRCKWEEKARLFL